MNKKDRGGPENEQPLSVGRVEYLEQARRRARSRRLRRTAAIVLVLSAVIAFATGAVSSSVSLAKDLVDTVQIALKQDPGWPQRTGLMELQQLEALSGSFVALGEESCVVYTEGGSRLNAIQSGYARPALAVGRTRFVLYDRAGRELRVDSRTQNLYTKTMDNSIYLCAMSRDGHLAVVTDNVRSAARLLVYSPSMEQQLCWDLTAAEGIPLRVAFSPDNKKLAAAAVTANAGQMVTNLYVLGVSQGDPVRVSTRSGSVPQWLGWCSDSSILLIYDSCAVLCDADGGEKAVYEFGGRTLAAVSAESGGIALLLTSGQSCHAVLLDSGLGVRYSGAVPSAHRILYTKDAFYLLTDDTVECYDLTGSHQWSQVLAARPQALLAVKNRLLVFCGNTVQELTTPESGS